MKPITYLYLFLVIIAGTSGCVLSDLTEIPTQVETFVSTTTPIPPTSTSTFTPTATATITPTLLATMEPEQAKETITTLLQEPGDCLAPCFWGIIPGQTTLDEAKNVFTRLGLPINSTTQDNREFYGIAYDFIDDLEIGIILGIQDNIVHTLDASITDTSEVGTPRKWSAYSPETLIDQYGVPSKVEFFIGHVTPIPTHSMVLYFEDAELIVSYTGRDLLNGSPQLEICPTMNRVEYIQIRVGKNQRHPPKQGVPLQEATSLNLKEFAKLMLGEPEDACLNLNSEAFP